MMAALVLEVWHFDGRLASLFDPCPPSVTPSLPVLMGYCLIGLGELRGVWQIQHYRSFAICKSEVICGGCEFTDNPVDFLEAFIQRARAELADEARVQRLAEQRARLLVDQQREAERAAERAAAAAPTWASKTYRAVGVPGVDEDEEGGQWTQWN